jgi:mono/diheme cytochrome c family protein
VSGAEQADCGFQVVMIFQARSGENMRLGFIGITGAGIVVLASIVSGSTSVQARSNPAKAEFYTTEVKPIFDANCSSCHEGTNHRGGLNLDTRESLLKGGHSGPAIVPNDPAKSLLVKLIRHEGPTDDPKNMPPNKPKLSDADIKTVEDWIKAGAIMPVEMTK